MDLGVFLWKIWYNFLMKKKKPTEMNVENRRARYDYQLGEELSVGMVLNGDQVRAIRDHYVQLKGSYVQIRRGELYLLGLVLGAETAQDIKLLATKKQIEGLIKQRTLGNTIVPVRMLGGARHIKLIIAVGKGKKKYDKRETIKRRDIDRGRF